MGAHHHFAAFGCCETAGASFQDVSSPADGEVLARAAPLSSFVCPLDGTRETPGLRE